LEPTSGIAAATMARAPIQICLDSGKTGALTGFHQHINEAMRVGVLTRGEIAELERVQRLGLRSIEWLSLADSPAGPANSDWKPFTEQLAAEANACDIRISAIGAYYQNPLDPKQTDTARSILRRAVEVASHVGIRTVAGFAGAVIETELNERGGNLVYKPFENYLPQLLAFGSRWRSSPRTKACASPSSIVRKVRITCRSCTTTCWVSRRCGSGSSTRPGAKTSASNGMPATSSASSLIQ